MSTRPNWKDAEWVKSHRSGDGGCVQIAFVGDRVGVRDSKDPAGPVLDFTRTEWAAFVAGVRDGSFGD